MNATPSDASVPGTARALPVPAGWIAAALVALFLVLAGSSARQHSEVLHEREYLYAGLQNLRHGERALAAGTPLGLLQLSALPLLALDVDPTDGPPRASAWLATRFVYDNRVPAGHILLAGRAPFLLLGALLGVLIFSWARRLYGERAGLLALALYALNPSLLAGTQFANQDFGVAALSTLALWALWRLCERVTAGRALAAGLALGAALLTKYTAFALVGVVPVVAAWDALARGRDGLGPRLARRALAVTACLGVAGLVVWADYGFTVGSLGAARAALVDAHPPLAAFSVCPAGTRHAGWVVPAPAWLCGLSSQIGHGYRIGHTSYLMGEVSSGGWWHYYLVTIASKQPLPILLFVLLRIGLGVRALAGGRRGGELRFLLFFPVLLLLVFSAADTQLGERYVFAAYPPLCVWLGGLAPWLGRVLWRRAAAALLVAWLAFGTLRIHPHYLMYFNEWAGGPERGWRRVVSGSDLGQDIGGLERWARDRGVRRIHLSCNGCDARLRFSDLPHAPLPCRPVPGFAAISVSRVLIPERGRPAQCADWLRAHEPVARIGYSILVYEIPAPGSMTK